MVCSHWYAIRISFIHNISTPWYTHVLLGLLYWMWSFGFFCHIFYLNTHLRIDMQHLFTLLSLSYGKIHGQKRPGCACVSLCSQPYACPISTLCRFLPLAVVLVFLKHALCQQICLWLASSSPALSRLLQIDLNPIPSEMYPKLSLNVTQNFWWNCQLGTECPFKVVICLAFGVLSHWSISGLLPLSSI